MDEDGVAQSKNQNFFDKEDAFLRTFWDCRGKHHWGYFETQDTSFADACDTLERWMACLIELDSSSTLLDVGCGNGAVAAELCLAYGCRVVGIDLSPVRIENARQTRAKLPEIERARLCFECASATDLPFGPESFSHAWSQATFFRVPRREAAIIEVHRVLRRGGRFVIDDIFMPKAEISLPTRIHVYDRWNCAQTFSFEGYHRSLESAGFVVRSATDLSSHLRQTFSVLRERTKHKAAEGGPNQDKYQAFSHAYDCVVSAVDQNELGWGLFLCEKPAR